MRHYQFALQQSLLKCIIDTTWCTDQLKNVLTLQQLREFEEIRDASTSCYRDLLEHDKSFRDFHSTASPILREVARTGTTLAPVQSAILTSLGKIDWVYN